MNNKPTVTSAPGNGRADRFSRVEQIYNQTLRRPEQERLAYLAQACAGDDDLRLEVEELLSFDNKAGRFIESPALEVAARALARTAEQSRKIDLVGQTILHYKVLEKIGEGGMGVVYRALDTHLQRPVAIKVLPPEILGDRERRRRFVQEARAASALNHPNIITIHDIDQVAGTDFIAMEYVSGKTLAELIPRKGMKLTDALKFSIQIADALAAAHAAGIVHRDLKPANVMITETGLVKVLDFGLAKLTERAESDASATTETLEPRTEEGAILGTVSYMSPEQAEGKPVDARSDVFSFGVVFYEMLTGCRPFRGDSKLSTLTAILRDPPPPVKEIRNDVPAEVESVLLKCLEKDRGLRYSSGCELAKAVSNCRKDTEPSGADKRPVWKRPWLAIPAALLALLAVITGGWALWRFYRIEWARNEAVPEILRLQETEDFWSAYRLALRAAGYIPDDPEVVQTTRNAVVATSINTSPPGAEIHVKSYPALDAEWDLLGVTPLQEIPMVLTPLRWRITKEGFEEVRGGFDVLYTPELEILLAPMYSGPEGMVFVPRGQRGSGHSRELEDYWIDRYEVTNRDYAEFVEAGGYQKREYWKQPIVKDGQEIDWEQAMREFVDLTGRSGPASWKLGAYPEGQGDYPVRGVSWFEAAAYAEFADKALPTIHHWAKAAGYGLYSDVLRFSNMESQGPVEAGSRPGIGPYGTYDMAGNVKEWCWNAAGERRSTRGAAWNEPSYLFMSVDAQLPYNRRENQGFRCVKYISPPPSELARDIETKAVAGDLEERKPADDEQFELIKRFYSYDPTDLNATVDAVDDSSPYWRQETVTFDAAYGGERVTADLFLPKGVSPPYQVVMICPSGGSNLKGRTFMPGVNYWSFFVRTGRAVMFPVWKGAFDRRVSGDTDGPNALRDLYIAQAKDLSRSVDYLETRNDVDHSKIGYWGISGTSFKWPIFAAVEKRIQAAVLWVGGLSIDPWRPPEVDAVNFVSRATAPVLLMNGRVDFLVPVESAQRLYNALGTPDEHKELFLFDGGHVPLQRDDIIKRTLAWFDKYLGTPG